MKVTWSDNTLVVIEANGRSSLLTCFADRIEIRGDGWDKRRTKRNPFPDGRVVKADSLQHARSLAEAVAQRLTETNQ